jgi:hypothetical protein
MRPEPPPIERKLVDSEPPPVRTRPSTSMPLPPPPPSEDVPLPDDAPILDTGPAPECVVDGGSLPFAAIALRPRPRSMRAIGIGAGVLAGGFVLAMVVAGQTTTDTPQPPPPAPAPAVAPAPAPAPQPAPAPAPATVQLHVTSEPTGATVVLDGVRLGTTPFTARVPIKKGEAVLKVRMQGRAAVKTKVSLEHDVEWNVPLHPLSKI